MVETLGVYVRLFTAQLRSQAQYPASFWIRIVLDVVVSGIEVLVVLAFFVVTPRLGGFGVTQAVLVTGLAQTSFGLAQLAVANVDRITEHIRTGTFDVLLLRPRAALGQLIVGEFEPRRVGRVVQGAAVLVTGVALVGLEWTPTRAGLLLATVLAGAVTFAAIMVLGAASMFWLVDAAELFNALIYGGREFTLYPTTVYPAVVRWVFGYGLGLATVAFLPTLALLGRPDPFGLPTWTHWAAPAACLPWVALAALAWRTGVRHYRSTGS